MKIRDAKEYRHNPSIQMVMFLLKDTKRTLRSKYTRIGRVNGRLSEIITEERQKIIDDSSPFIKFYIDSDSLNELIGLSKPAQKVLAYIISKKVQFKEDWFYWDNTVCAREMGTDNKYTWNGFTELLSKEWIYKAVDKNKYWINLCFMSYGKREDIVKHYIDITK